MTPDYDEWDMKLSEWRGYVLRALEDANNELKEIKECQKEIKTDIVKINNRITSIQIKVASIGGVSGLITSLVLWLITRI